MPLRLPLESQPRPQKTRSLIFYPQHAAVAQVTPNLETPSDRVEHTSQLEFTLQRVRERPRLVASLRFRFLRCVLLVGHVLFVLSVPFLPKLPSLG